MLVIMCALGEWRHFLKGSDQKFEIHTDHKNLSYFQCRQDISSVSNPPIGTSFGPQNIPLPLQVKNPTIGMLFLIRITKTHFPHSLETETQLCHKMRLIPMIPTILHTPYSMHYSLTCYY